MEKPDVEIHVLDASPAKLYITASVPGAMLSVGMATFALNDAGQPFCELVHVEERWRRHGVATALYANAEQHFGKSLIVSDKLTPDSVAFLTARGLTIPATAVVKAYDEWLDAPSSTNEFDYETEDA